MNTKLKRNLIQIAQRTICSSVILVHLLIFGNLITIADCAPTKLDELGNSSTVSIANYTENVNSSSNLLSSNNNNNSKSSIERDSGENIDTIETISMTSTTTEKYPTLYSEDDTYGKQFYTFYF